MATVKMKSFIFMVFLLEDRLADQRTIRRALGIHLDHPDARLVVELFVSHLEHLRLDLWILHDALAGPWLDNRPRDASYEQHWKPDQSQRQPGISSCAVQLVSSAQHMPCVVSQQQRSIGVVSRCASRQ